MHLHRLTACWAVTLAFGLVSLARAELAAVTETNFWPGPVSQLNATGKVVSTQTVGPVIFSKVAEDGSTINGVRPFYARFRNAGGATREIDVVYPIFTYRTDGEAYRWSILQLINRSGNLTTSSGDRLPPTFQTFDVWPFWFSRNTGSPDSSYKALLPIAGTIKSRFGYDQLSWTLFPLYGRAEKNAAVTLATPWPFIKTTSGTEHGFAFWPLFGWRTKEGRFDRRFYLWPLGFDNTIAPPEESPAGTAPRREVGFLPFYSRETAPGYVNASFLWPFFGYTDRTQPTRYHETRYFWPFLVQGRGDRREVNRYGPFYTHSINKEIEKTWVLWPVYREKKLAEGGIAQRQQQVLYFLYWSLQQRSLTNPSAAPAQKAHLWPIYSTWDNGAGRTQFQFPSPLEIFFPTNEQIHQSWSPLFALYRKDQRAPGTVRHEALWGLISWSKTPVRQEFRFGPLLSIDTASDGKRVSIGSGLLGWQRAAASRWRSFWFDFHSRPPHSLASSR